ncbi:MAG: right-handed parallel beta-helix repeat-containing protein, partial [Chthoniobacteraceae bacterium]|nr:right-handed parallel beta-helix repeat-containing protein [Chthoniobacteraceae bacterium]
WSGRQPSAPSSGNEGPFATLERARSAVREARASGDRSQQTVSVRAGIYRVKEAFNLGKADSGEDGSPVVWRAFPGEEPVLNGAEVLEGWTPWKNGIFKAPLPKAGKGVRQLLLNGERQTLARYPNATPEDPVAGGWAFADGPQWPMYADIPGEDKRTLQVRPPDWRQWARPSQVELCIFPRFNWWNNRVKVQSVDPASNKVTLAGDCSYPIRNGDRFFFQNALEELDIPGEWYADTEEGALYFWPPAGSNPEDATPVVSQSLVKMEQGAHDIVWQGFIMEGCDASAIVLTETRRCIVENNWIRAVGDWNGHGVSVSKGVENRVRHNRFEQIGNTAIVLNGGDIPTLTAANNVAEHNEIHHFGVYYKQGLGISLSGVGNKALHNHIHHGPRFGINHNGNRNEIAFN